MRQTLIELERDAPGFLAEFFQEFTQTTAARLAAMRTAVRDGDHEGVRVLSHTLRGTCATAGAARMATLAERMERGGDTSATAETLLRRLHAEYGRTRRELEETVHAAGAQPATL